MNQNLFYLAGDTAALQYAAKFLSQRGISISPTPCAQVTHLLLPVPSFDKNDVIKGGGSIDRILPRLPESITIIGGNLDSIQSGEQMVIDLLKDPYYLSENAAITADCAIRIAGSNLPVVFRGCPMLVIGWGRIGKCLASQRKNMGANVSVFARRAEDRATLTSLGYNAIAPENLAFALPMFRVVFNTATAPVLEEQDWLRCADDCIKIELASDKFIPGKDVIWARGLPNRDVPESSGALIARSVIRFISQKEDFL